MGTVEPNPAVMHTLAAMSDVERSAYERGLQEGRTETLLKNHFVDDDRRFAEIVREQVLMSAKVERIEEKVTKLREVFDLTAGITADRSKRASEQAAKQLSSREFWLGLVAAVVALGSFLAAIGHV